MQGEKQKGATIRSALRIFCVCKTTFSLTFLLQRCLSICLSHSSCFYLASHGAWISRTMAFAETDVRRSHNVLGGAVTQQRASSVGSQRATSPAPNQPSSTAPNADVNSSSGSAITTSVHRRPREDARAVPSSRYSFDSINDDPFFRAYRPPDRLDEDRPPPNSRSLTPRNDTPLSQLKQGSLYRDSPLYSESYDLVRLRPFHLARPSMVD